MAGTIETAQFRDATLALLDEVFEKVQGIILDSNTSFFETLSGISAQEASVRVSSQGACLAAQVNHARFYLDVLLAESEDNDWAGSWAIESVTDEEWQSLIDGLRTSYAKVRDYVTTFDDWDTRHIGGAIALIAHSAYHLGEVRAGISVIRDRAA